MINDMPIQAHTQDSSDHTVNFSSVLEAKGYHLPGFLVRRIEKFLHLDYFNAFFARGYEGVEFCEKALEYVGVSVETEGIGNVPVDGSRYTFVSNHPLGGLDSIAIASIVGRRFGENIRFFMNDFLMGVKGLSVMAVPVSMTGGQSRSLSARVDEAFNSDSQIIMFPAGLCSRRMADGRIRDLPWGKLFIRKSVEAGRKVVPIHVVGRNSDRFYRVAALSKALGFKFNFAMAFLPDEMYKARNSTVRISMGSPISPSVFDGSRTASQWAQWVRERVYEL